MKGLIFALLSMAGSLAYAGGASTGGGGVVYCPATSSVELFDYYEGRTLRKLTFDLGPSTLTYMERVHFVLDRLSHLDPALSGQLWQMAKDFDQTAAFVPDAKLNPIDDVNGVFLPTGCDYVQAVAQRDPLAPEDPYYIVDKNLWDLMSEETKAGVILHEVIYHYHRQLIGESLKDSSRARYLNARISSPTIATTSSTDYAKIKVTADTKPSFLWQDSQSNWWYASAQWDTYQDCQGIGRKAVLNDVATAYPDLGLALKTQGLFDFYDYIDEILIQKASNDGSAGGIYLRADRFSDIKTCGYHNSYVFCISQTNPIPL